MMDLYKSAGSLISIFVEKQTTHFTTSIEYEINNFTSGCTTEHLHTAFHAK